MSAFVEMRHAGSSSESYGVPSDAAENSLAFQKVEFRILGPLELRVGGVLRSLPGERLRIVLAALLVADGNVVSVDRLIDAVWGEMPPATAEKQIRNSLSELRHQLHGLDALLETVRPGYRLTVMSGEIDVATFRSGVALARRHVMQSSPTEAIVEFRKALALWRGAALCDLDSAELSAKVRRLDEERFNVLEECIELELEEGDNRAVVAELFELVTIYPERERLVGYLMSSLYESGERARAISVYDQVRQRLNDEFGAPPSDELGALRKRIHSQEPVFHKRLEVVGRRVSALPPDVRDFVGRERELAEILDATTARTDRSRNVLVVDGMAGIGKTALAVRAAHLLSDRWPDARLFVDMRSHDNTGHSLSTFAALDVLLRALGVRTRDIPDDLEGRLAYWHTELAGRPLFVVLDDIADSGQVRPLLPGDSDAGCFVLVTSRYRLTGLDGVQCVSLDVLSNADGRELLVRTVGQHRVHGESAAVDDVVRYCGHLPLAIRIAAARLRHRPDWRVADIVRRLVGDEQRLEELCAEDRSVAGAFKSSYRRLTAEQKRVLRSVCQASADHIGITAAGLADIPVQRAERLLEGLVDRHLLVPAELGHYRVHGLLRAYALTLPNPLMSGASTPSLIGELGEGTD